MQEKTLPNEKNASLAKPNLGGKKELAENALNEKTKAQLNDGIWMAALEGNDVEITNLLLAGADVNAKDGEGKTALHWAAYRGAFKTCTFLLEKGADIEAKCKMGYTVFLYAVMWADIETCKFLMEKGANVNAINNAGETAFMLAAQPADAETCAFLVENGTTFMGKEAGKLFMPAFRDCISQ
jgi:ankyrin repeat protein